MRKHLFILFLIPAMVGLMILSGYSGDMSKDKSKYAVVVTHTPEKCLAQLDEIGARGGDLLNQFEWGCKSGDHTGWAFIEAKDEASVRDKLPMNAREDTKIVKVNKFTPADLKAIHEKMKK